MEGNKTNAAFNVYISTKQRVALKKITFIQPKPVFYLAENHKLFRKDILSVIDRYDGKLIELSMEESGLKMSDFADMSHLNKYGAEKYSNALMRSIEIETLVAKK